MKRYDLMHSINTRGTFLASKLCLPHLKNSNHAHILNLSPPLNMNPFWFSVHVAYTMAKYGMSMCVLGMSEEFKPYNIGVNALWPMTGIATAAIEMLTGDVSTSRKPEIVSDAAYYMLSQDPKTYTGNFAIDEDVVKKAGVKDLTPYACDPKNANNLIIDGFLDDPRAMKHHTFMKANAAARRYHTSAVNYDKKGEPKGQIPTLFAAIGKSLSPELVQKTQAVYQFNVSGKEEGVWHIDLKNGDGSCGQGEPKNPPDATLTMDGKNFADMFAGKLKPATAFMMGKLKIKGDLQKAMKLEKMMKSLQKKN
ncbi:hydroxysteroid dehydrogenase-like protein 2 isoform X1 [Choristoneura fumiferana]|uniref:hydroxysteroid dehydrogenase-like protein 2 isoform X1 n=1 Tax=Choristoneura fumiferana TaxID=7141 RepID=UPI003D15B019